MGDGIDEYDALGPGPAVALRSHICGRRSVRVPEIAHASPALEDREEGAVPSHELMQSNSREPLTTVAALKGASNGAARA